MNIDTIMSKIPAELIFKPCVIYAPGLHVFYLVLLISLSVSMYGVYYTKKCPQIENLLRQHLFLAFVIKLRPSTVRAITLH